MSEHTATAPSGPVAVPPPDDMKRCRICATKIALEAVRCTTCESWQDGKLCLVCSSWIPKSAFRCGTCNTFQDWRRRIPGNEVVLALLVSLLSVLSTAIPAILYVVRLPSDTTAVVLDPEYDPEISSTKRVLLVRAFNAGGSSTIVRGATLDLANVNAAAVELSNKTPRNSEVPAGKQTDVKFFASVVRPSQGTTKEKVASLLCTESVDLLLQVDEQTRFGKFVPLAEPMRVAISGRQIRPWILDKMAVEGTSCD